MTKLQSGISIGAVLLLLVMYFGCDTKPPKQKEIEKTRIANAETTGIRTLEKEAKDTLNQSDAGFIAALENAVQTAPNDSAKLAGLKRLSSNWFRLGRPDIAGYYAEEVAEKSEDEQSWSIAGTTYNLCIQRIEEQKIRDFCTKRAVNAFESAISLNPENTSHRVNLALCYTENPPQDNPMKGVLLLVDLVKQYPEDPLVLSNLGRLAIKTGQWAKAKERLESAYKFAPNDKGIICLLADTYTQLKDPQAAAFAEKCTK